MQRADYHAFTQQLIDNLQADPRVVGLIATGSMGSDTRQPDEFSDHDFWVVAEDAETIRQNPDWLPPYKEIVLQHRETQHGVQIIYADGHLLEYAVFAPDELHVARVNDYRILIDKTDITAQLADIHTRTYKEAEDNTPTLDHLFREVLTRCLVGSMRYARGEKISAHRFVKLIALESLLKLVWRLHEPETDHPADNLDPFRRLEAVHPTYGEKINALLLQDVPTCAIGFLDIAAGLMLDAGHNISGEAVQAVITVIDRAHDSAI